MSPNPRPTFPLKKVLLIAGSVAIVIIITVCFFSRSTLFSPKASESEDTLFSDRNLQLITPNDTTPIVPVFPRIPHVAYEFKDQDISMVILQLTYDFKVDVEYISPIGKHKFTGVIPANLPLEKSLQLVSQKSHIYFQIDSTGIFVADDASRLIRKQSRTP